ncbi:ion transporter [Motiliproteus sp. SC1-56]|uniref:ion transporter n=1 Tax=Motiliproteus sp. SC1-56 TaxID=2799565 RepID=UPI001A8DCF2C|nr:ion transporter [Motiliproteus sp. SC1-56]
MNTPSLQQRFGELRSNKLFELFVVAVIIGSALLVGAKTYELHPLTQQAITWLDRLVTLIFLAEISIRFLGEEQKRHFFRNGWNVFDTLIVVVSLIPIDNSDMALVARLVRVFRVLRMVSIIPELRLLLNSLLKALPQLGYVLLLMFIIFYIYAAMGSTLFEHINEELWGDVSIALLTLFRVMTFEDWTDVMYETMVVYPLSWVYYITFIFFTAFAFLNMVIGIVVNVMNDEHAKVLKQKAKEAHEPTLVDLYAKLEAMEAQLQRQAGAENASRRDSLSG